MELNKPLAGVGRRATFGRRHRRLIENLRGSGFLLLLLLPRRFAK